ncbi:IS66 family transposase [Limnoglobus roseus]|uniref:IS66 family transposase n=1 Tax=Limnoglobus roseus TaxID=2598579 RepID=A0A5C1AA16_9BACT|nr:transposase [Limnoglobus roseus]QEL15580.1 IS66 family transposase [Limnoglobus roseus]
MTPREVELDRENAHLRATVAELHAVVADLRRTIEGQQAHIDRLVKMAFGRTSERVVGPTLFDAGPPPGVEAGVSRLPRPSDPPSNPPRGRGHGRRPVATDLPVERVGIDLSEAAQACPCGGEMRVRVGLGGPARRYDDRPASVFVRGTVRVSFAGPGCERAGHDPRFARPPLPSEPIPRSSVAAGLLAHVAVSEFVGHLPLHRLEHILARHGLVAPRSTLCDWVRGCAAALEPVYRAMVARVKRSYAIHADETPVTLLRPRRTAYAWAYLGDAAVPFIVSDLTPGRSQEFPARFRAGFTGFVQADAYAGYDSVHRGMRHVGGWGCTPAAGSTTQGAMTRGPRRRSPSPALSTTSSGGSARRARGARR